MVLEAQRDRFQDEVGPLVERLAAWRITPSMLTWTAIVLAAVAGGLLYMADPSTWWFFLVAAALMGLSALLDGLDGALARATGTADAQGDLLDHVTDRYADLFVLTGLMLNPNVFSILPGFLAVTGTLLTSYMGTQAQALGLGRLYKGVLNRADRFMALVIGLPAVGIAWWWNPGLTAPALTYLLWAFGLLSHFTALQRWREIHVRLGE